MTATIDPQQRRSRRIMLVIGAVALVALAGPWLWRSWQEAHLTDGRVKVRELTSTKSSLDIAMCLMKREPGGLSLAISSENHFTDPAHGLVVEIAAIDARRDVSVWLPPNMVLQPGEINQLEACTSS